MTCYWSYSGPRPRRSLGQAWFSLFCWVSESLKIAQFFSGGWKTAESALFRRIDSHRWFNPWNSQLRVPTGEVWTHKNRNELKKEQESNIFPLLEPEAGKAWFWQPSGETVDPQVRTRASRLAVCHLVLATTPQSYCCLFPQCNRFFITMQTHLKVWHCNSCVFSHHVFFFLPLPGKRDFVHPHWMSFSTLDGDVAQEVRAVVWQSEGCRFDPTLGVSKCPWARHLTPDCSWRAGWYLAWQPIAVGVWMCVWMGEWEA